MCVRVRVNKLDVYRNHQLNALRVKVSYKDIVLKYIQMERICITMLYTVCILQRELPTVGAEYVEKTGGEHQCGQDQAAERIRHNTLPYTAGIVHVLPFIAICSGPLL